MVGRSEQFQRSAPLHSFIESPSDSQVLILFPHPHAAFVRYARRRAVLFDKTLVSRRQHAHHPSDICYTSRGRWLAHLAPLSLPNGQLTPLRITQPRAPSSTGHACRHGCYRNGRAVCSEQSRQKLALEGTEKAGQGSGEAHAYGGRRCDCEEGEREKEGCSGRPRQRCHTTYHRALCTVPGRIAVSVDRVLPLLLRQRAQEPKPARRC